MDDLAHRLRHGYGESPRALMMEAADRIERLEQWRTEAHEVLGRWERVWEAAGRPGPLGGSKADNVLAWLLERPG